VVGVAGESLAADERRILRRFPPAGVILFARNVVSEAQLSALAAEIRGELPDAFLAVDQEGGPVDRFRALTGGSPSFASAARAGSAELAGLLAGEICAAFTIDWNLAPVVDRAVEGAGKSILSRRAAFEDGAPVAAAARDFLRALAAFGVAGCLKHFPGLGRAEVDSHRSLPRVSAGADLAADLSPFAALAPAAPAVMISHAAIGSSPLPATLDRAIAHDLLRGEVRFEGAAISDDLEMGALAEFGGIPERAAAAFGAGCDLLCVGKETTALPEATAAIEERASAERRMEAARRVSSFRGELARLRRERRLFPRGLPEIAAAFRRASDRLA